MFRSLQALVPPELAKWWALFVLLIVPGSFIVLPVLWLMRLWSNRVPATPVERTLPASEQASG